MDLENKHTGLYTDHYELTMAQGYFMQGMTETPAVFDYLFRSNPYQGGYTVFAGLSSLLEGLSSFSFDKESCRFLKSVNFDTEFLKYLERFRFNGDVYAVKEGEVVFPYEPLLRVEGNIIETQLVETLLLNAVNFESLIATKAARIRQSAGERKVIDFGFRRSHGTGGVQASKAAVSGGIDGTSNVISAFRYGLETKGTMAHSWVQSFEDELTAFRAYAEIYPDNCILLVDTYDTLNNGLPNAIRVGREMAKKGRKLLGIRLDSGDIEQLSKSSRELLDRAGLNYVKIVASNQLDEYSIRDLLDRSAPIDVFGVGTSLVTGRDSGALDGVFKLCSVNGRPSLKRSDSPAKITLPGKKKLVRFTNADGMFMADGITLDEEKGVTDIFDPGSPSNSFYMNGYPDEFLLEKVMEKGNITGGIKSPSEVSRYAAKRIASLPEEYKQFTEPQIYRTGISRKLLELRDRLVRNNNQGGEK